MPKIRIQALKDGPLLVQGEAQIYDSGGEMMQEGGQFALCRCGQSGRKPFCDGMHAKTGFQSTCARQTAAGAGR